MSKRVVFITEEDDKAPLLERVKIIKKGLGLEKTPLPIKYLCLNNFKLDIKNKKFEKLIAEIESFKPDLIIVDPIQRCVSFNVDTDNQEISNFLTDVVMPLRKKYGCGFLFVSHLRKSPTMNVRVEDPLDEVRGGSELTNIPRYVLSCQTPKYQIKTNENSEMMVFRVLKMSHSKKIDAKVISFTSQDDSLKIAYEGLPSEVLAGEVQCAEAIKEWLFENQMTEEFQTKDVTDATDKIGFKKSMLSEGLKVLLKRDFLQKIKRGVWKVNSKEVSFPSPTDTSDTLKQKCSRCKKTIKKIEELKIDKNYFCSDCYGKEDKK